MGHMDQQNQGIRFTKQPTTTNKYDSMIPVPQTATNDKTHHFYIKVTNIYGKLYSDWEAASLITVELAIYISDFNVEMVCLVSIMQTKVAKMQTRETFQLLLNKILEPGREDHQASGIMNNFLFASILVDTCCERLLYGTGAYILFNSEIIIKR